MMMNPLNETTDEVDDQQNENQELSINPEDDTDDLNQSDVEETQAKKKQNSIKF